MQLFPNRSARMMAACKMLSQSVLQKSSGFSLYSCKHVLPPVSDCAQLNLIFCCLQVVPSISMHKLEHAPKLMISESRARADVAISLVRKSAAGKQNLLSSDSQICLASEEAMSNRIIVAGSESVQAANNGSRKFSIRWAQFGTESHLFLVKTTADWILLASGSNGVKHANTEALEKVSWHKSCSKSTWLAVTSPTPTASNVVNAFISKNSEDLILNLIFAWIQLRDTKSRYELI
eukprot:780453_1